MKYFALIVVALMLMVVPAFATPPGDGGGQPDIDYSAAAFSGAAVMSGTVNLGGFTLTRASAYNDSVAGVAISTTSNPVGGTVQTGALSEGGSSSLNIHFGYAGGIVTTFQAGHAFATGSLSK